MESKSLSNLASFKKPSVTPNNPQVVDVPPAEIANLVAIRLLDMNLAVRVTRQGK